MSASTPLLAHLESEPDISNAQYVGRTTCTRKNWRWRFLLLALFGTVVTVILGRNIYVATTSYTAQYVLFGRTKLSLSLADAEAVVHDTLAKLNLARNWSYEYTQDLHRTGESRRLVDWTLEKFKEYGLSDTKVETYYVYTNKPVDNALKLVEDGKVTFEASLKEDSIAEDPSTLNNTIPVYHAYSASGNVSSSYFYANYGRREDYQALVARGYNLTGKIAIVRYQGLLRGLKVKFAEEVGAAGVVMYSDPSEDGDHTTQNGYKMYPEGPAKQDSSVQRGSVMFLTEGAGDPTTPGYASRKNAKREDPLKFIPKIPSLPVSQRDITPILKKLNGIGPKASSFGKDWTGKLEGYDYSIGLTLKDKHVSPVLNLYNEQNYEIVPIHNVLGTIPGQVSEEVIVFGNHRDAWIRGGAGDPNSGSAIMLEVMRALQVAIAKGYKPYRTIVFASWDGEEYGLLGSTEWAEDHSAWIQKKVVAYVNIDTGVSGSSLLMGASPLVKEVMLNATKQVNYPKGGTMYDHYVDGPLKGEVPYLGSGSDFAVFVSHLGVPAFEADFFNDPSTDPVYHYHSIYDSFHWMDKYCDPGFIYHNTMAQYYSKNLLQLSGREFLPLSPDFYADEIDRYISESLKQVPTDWYHYENDEFSFEIENGRTFHEAISDHRPAHDKPLRHRKPPHRKIKDFTDAVKATKEAVKYLQRQARLAVAERNQCQTKLNAKPGHLWDRVKLMSRLSVINAKFNLLERVFLHSGGLDDRPWFKHIMFASGRYTGYDGQAIPGFQEAVEDNDKKKGLKWLNILWTKIMLAGFMLSA
ncbi:hypothetical protein PUMCH_000845 [Australozyma saopauloensis]|uniref:Uncharacterized protein n=1 Tax=Australozyma saopauloensis TaxID=291208 RepID=A0AAX4H5V0_9ASCO|nr:hypothetical protein PUMCH_000845 [[Candida] saopauloensis]